MKPSQIKVGTTYVCAGGHRRTVISVLKSGTIKGSVGSTKFTAKLGGSVTYKTDDGKIRSRELVSFAAWAVAVAPAEARPS